MSDFIKFRDLVTSRFDHLSKGTLFAADVDGNDLWESYLKSFPEGSNPIFKERTVHDCQTCKRFIKNMGGVVSISEGRVRTIWDINIGGVYQSVADALAKKVRSAGIKDVFLSSTRAVGCKRTSDGGPRMGSLLRGPPRKRGGAGGGTEYDQSPSTRQGHCLSPRPF